MLKKDILDSQLTVEEAYEIYLIYIQDDWVIGALYIRVSTNDQIEYSPASQIKLGLKYAIEHKIKIPKEFIFQDDGKSGRKTANRLSFMKMISLAKKKPKPFSVILIYSFSRFARNREDSIVYKSMLRKKLGIDVISITQPLSEGKESILLESLYEAMDEYYSLDLAENSLRGKHEKATRGEHNGNAPYGYYYDKNTKSLMIDEEKASVIKMIFNDYVNDPNMNVKKIVCKLNAMGIKATRGGLWGDRTIKLILHNPTYIGKVRFTLGGMERDYYNPNTQIYDGKHQPIIDMETWNKAQELNLKRREIYSKYMKPAPKYEHWLRGILKCGDCGHSLVKQKARTRTKAHFQCAGYVKGKCTRSHHIREELVIPIILEQIKKDYTEKIDINIVEKEINYDDDIDLVMKQIKRIEEKENRVKLAYENGIDSIEEYKENKNRLKKEKDKLNQQLEELKYTDNQKERKNEIYKKCENAYKILQDENTPDNIKMTISHELFEKIVYDKDNEELVIYYK